MSRAARGAGALAGLREAARRLSVEQAGGAPVVFGEGDAAAPLALVGETPGETEARTGRPFVGRAGRLLDELLAEAGLDRDAVWITNVVKIRPTAGENPRLRNRPPRVSEVRAWLPVLEAELEAVGPTVVVGLGAVAGRALVGTDFHLTRQRGAWLEDRQGRPCLVTYHPAFILRQQGEALAEVRRQAASDFAAVRARLADLGALG